MLVIQQKPFKAVFCATSLCTATGRSPLPVDLGLRLATPVRVVLGRQIHLLLVVLRRRIVITTL